MKKLFYVTILSLVSFFLLNNSIMSSPAYASYITRSVYFSHPTQFDGYWSASKIAVLKQTAGTLDATFHQNIPQVAYRGYLYYLGSWKVANVKLIAPGSVVLKAPNVAFSPIKNDRLAAYLQPIAAGEGYYGTSIAWIFEKEKIKTLSNWTYTPQKAIAPNIYTSPNISSPTGRKIAGLEFNVNFFNGYTINPACINGSAYECGFFTFAPSASKFGWGNNIRGKIGYVFKSSGEQPYVNFKITPDDTTGCNGVCWAEGKIGSNNNVIIYTRPQGTYQTDPAPLPPLQQSTATPTPTGGIPFTPLL